MPDCLPFLPTNLPAWLHMYLPIYLSAWLPACLPTYLPVYVPTYLSTYLSAYEAVYLLTYPLHASLSRPLPLSLCVSVPSPSVHERRARTSISRDSEIDVAVSLLSLKRASAAASVSKTSATSNWLRPANYERRNWTLRRRVWNTGPGTLTPPPSLSVACVAIARHSFLLNAGKVKGITPSIEKKRGVERRSARRSSLKGREKAIVNQTNVGALRNL